MKTMNALYTFFVLSVLLPFVTMAQQNCPTITSLTPSASVCTGSNFTMQVVANTNGGGTLQYQWTKGGLNIPGATNASYSINTVQTTDAATYAVNVSNGCGTVTTSDNIQLTVNQRPIITLNPQSANVCTGATLTLNANASGSLPMTFKWQKDNVDLASTTNSITIGTVATGDAGNYTFVASNACGPTTSQAAAVTVKQAPTINSLTAPATVCQGATATLTASVIGNGDNNITHVWKYEGTTITAPNQPTLVVPNFQSANAGNYTLEVTNSCNAGTPVTRSVSIQLVGLPTIAAETNKSVCLNTNLVVNPTITNVTGSNVTYQWFFESNPLPDQRAAQLSVNTIKANQAGRYYLAINNGCAATVSGPIFNVNVIENPVIRSQSNTQQSLCVGGAINLSVDALHAQNYQWKKDGVTIVGATASQFSKTNILASDAGQYTVEITNSCGFTLTSNVFNVTVGAAPTTASTLTDITACVGQSPLATVVANANGGTNLQYQWTRGGTDIPGATSASYSFNNVQTVDAGAYAVKITSSCGNVTSNTFQLLVNQRPIISVNPLSTSICLGNTLTLSATVSGATSVKWQKNNSDLAATTNSLSISNVAASDAGNYTFIASNTCGATTSAVAVVSIKQSPTINSLTAPATVCQGATATLTASVSGNGDDNLTYVWKLGGSVVATTSQPTIEIPNFQSTNAGTYTLEVTNSCNIQSPVTRTVSIQMVSLPVISVVSDQNACVSTNLIVSPTVTNLSGNNITYQWFFEGAALPAQRAAQLNLNNIQSNQAGRYYLAVNNGCASTVSGAVFNVNVFENPVIRTLSNTQQSLCVGNNLSLSVDALNGQTYQWKKNGVNINGATSAQYSKIVESVNDAGQYTVAISNSCGYTLTSSVINISVGAAPSITTAPLNVTACVGQSATASVVANANGGGALQYRWSAVNEPNTVLGTASTFTIANVIIANAKSYAVVVSNTCGQISGGSFALAVADKPSVTITTSIPDHPQAGYPTVCLGSSITFSANQNANGASPTYTWYKDDVSRGAQASPGLTIMNSQVSDAGTYKLFISNTCGGAFSNPIKVGVHQQPEMVSHPQTQTVCEGVTISLSGAARNKSGTVSNITYAWMYNGAGFPGSAASISLTNIEVRNTGTYKLQATNECGTVSSNDAIVTVVSKPKYAILTPANQLSLCGPNNQTRTLSLNVFADNGTAPTIVWSTDFGNIIGPTTGTSITIGAVGREATYFAVMNNACGTTNLQYQGGDGIKIANETNLPVVTSKTTAPDNEFCEGENMLLNVKTNSVGSETYTWKLNGNIVFTNQSGNTRSSDYQKLATANDGGNYTVDIANACGTTLNAATIPVVVNPKPIVSFALTSQNNQCLSGNSYVFTNNSTNTGGNIRYTWDFGDGNTNTVAVASASHTYTVSGKHMVKLTAINQYGCFSENTVEVTVAGQPIITTQPVGKVVCQGEPYELAPTVNTGGASSVSYQWYLNGQPISSSNAVKYNIASMSAANQGEYYLKVTNSGCNTSVESQKVNVLFQQRPAASFTVDKPLNACVDDATYTFTNTTPAISGVTYLWNISDGTSSTNVNLIHRFVNTGLYTVSLTATAAGCSSTFQLNNNNNARIRIDGIPTLNKNLPAQISLKKGDPITLDVTAIATNAEGQQMPLTYTWYKLPSTNQIGTNNNTFSAITSALVSDSGRYYVVVNNSCGSVQSNVVTIRVNDVPSIVKQPVAITACIGKPATLEVETATTDNSTPVYQWYYKKDVNETPVPVPESNTPVLQLASFTQADAGHYFVKVSNSIGEVESNAVIITAEDLPQILFLQSTPSIQSGICVGSNLQFNASVTSRAGTPFTVTWQQNGIAVNGQTTTQYILSNITKNQDGEIAILATNACGTVSEKIDLKVIERPQFTLNPLPVSACLNGTASFTARVLETEIGNPSGFEWLKDNIAFSGAAIASREQLIFSAVQVTDAGAYALRSSNVCGITTSASAQLTVVATGPQITQQPSAISACVGTAQRISVSTAGNQSELRYAWYKDGNVISGQIASGINFGSIARGDAGTYSVIVTNACNLSTTSNTSQVVIKEAVSLVQSIANKQLCLGTDLDTDISTSLSGVEPATTYQWTVNGANITDASALTSRIRLRAITIANEGNYAIIATNSCGTASLPLFALKVLSLPEITTQPIAGSVCEGASFTNRVIVANPNQIPVSYQWLQDGVLLPNGNTSQLLLQNIGSANTGLYAVRVTNICGTTTSSSARLSLTGAPRIIQNPLPIDACAGTEVSTTLLASSDDNVLTYAWFKNNVLLNGQTSNKLSFASISPSDSGTYRVVVTNACNVSESASGIAVRVRERIGVASTLPDAQRCVGTNFSVDVTRNLTNVDLNATFQWRLNGVDLVNASATSRNLVINNLSSVHTGQYNLVATNGCGAADLSMFKLNVVTLPSISRQPIPATLCEDASWINPVELSNADQAGMMYQWFKDALPLPSATGASLVINQISGSDQGVYYVRVTSACGEVLSNRVNLTVRPKPEVGISLNTTPPTQCLDNNLFQFVSSARSSDNTPVDLTWDFGDGVFSKQASPSHRYQFSDQFKVYLYGKSQYGCLDTALLNVTVNNKPIIINDLVGQTICANGQLNLNIDAKLLPNENVSYQWFFNQNLILNQNNKSLVINRVTASNGGTYAVRITNACGSNLSSEAKVQIADKPLIVTQLPLNEKICEGAPHILKPTVFSLLPNTYQWFRNDLPLIGKTQDSLLINRFAGVDVGSYSVRIENLCGTTLSPKGNLIMKNIPSTTYTFTTDTVCFAADKVLEINPIFNNDDTLRISWYANNQLIASGTSNLLRLNQFAASQSGLYRAVLENSCGQLNVPVASLVLNRIRAGFRIDTTDACLGKLKIDLIDTSRSFFPIVQQYWDIPQERAVLPNLPNPSYQFTRAGRFQVRHAVADAFGCVSDTVFAVTTNYEKPKADFYIADTCLTMISIPRDSSKFGIGSSRLVRYQWNFGDTVMFRANGVAPGYTYKTPGEKQVQLIVWSDSSCVSDTVVKKLMVIGRPVASFATQDSCMGFPVLFDNRSFSPFVPDSTVQFLWNFDDGSTSTLKHPQHIFKNYGAHRVRLTAFSAICPFLSDDTLINMSIKVPRVDLTYPRVQGVKGVLGQLAAKGDGRSYSWAPFTGLNNTRIANPTYKLSDSKVMYTITIVDSAGCVYKDKQEVWAFDKPDIYIATGFSPNNDGVNDTYAPEYIEIRYLEYFRIADKNNRQIFITNDMKQRWDGTYKGNPLPPDPYVVTVAGIDIFGNRITKQGVLVLVK